MFKKLLLLLSAVSLVSCANYSESFEPIDQRNKTITTQTGGDQVLRNIKSALKRNGWKTYAVASSGEVTIGNLKQNKYRSKYQLLGNSGWVDIGLTGNLYAYNYTVVNLHSGEEVAAINGTYKSAKAIADELIRVLQ